MELQVITQNSDEYNYSSGKNPEYKFKTEKKKKKKKKFTNILKRFFPSFFLFLKEEKKEGEGNTPLNDETQIKFWLYL